MIRGDKLKPSKSMTDLSGVAATKSKKHKKLSHLRRSMSESSLDMLSARHEGQLKTYIQHWPVEKLIIIQLVVADILVR